MMARKSKGYVVREIKHRLGDSEVKFKLVFGEDNIYRIALPDNMREALGINEFTGDNPITVSNALIEACWKFETTTAIEEKVILYKISANVRTWRAHGINAEGGMSGETEEFQRKDFCNQGDHGETTLSFGYRVLRKRTFAGNIRYYTLDADVYECLNTMTNYGTNKSFPASLFREYKEMSWSEHREAFFKSAKGNFQQLIIKLIDFIEMDPGESAKLVDRSPVTGLLGSGKP